MSMTVKRQVIVCATMLLFAFGASPAVAQSVTTVENLTAEQVLVNLAVNGRDAMPGGGTLTVATSHFVIREPLKIGEDVMPVGHWVRIDVSDTGTGIPPEIIDRIFEPFFTTKDVGQGNKFGVIEFHGERMP